MPSSSPELMLALAEVPRILAGPVVVLDGEARILHLNPAAAALGDWALEEVRGLPAREVLIPASHQDEFQELFGEVMEGRITHPVEMPLRTPDGGRRTLLWTYTLLPASGDGEKAAGVLATGTDLTELRRLQEQDQALRDSEARVAGIVAVASDAIISIDRNHCITLFNQGAEAMFGYRADEIMGAPLDGLLPERARSIHHAHIDGFAASPVQARRMAERQRISGLRKSGEEFPAEASILKLSLGGDPMFTVVLRDVSERVRRDNAQAFLDRIGDELSRTLELDDSLHLVAELTVEALADFCLLRLETDETGEGRQLEAHHHRWELGRRARELEVAASDLLQRVARGEPPIDWPHLPELAPGDQEDDTLSALRAGGIRSCLVVPMVARGRVLGAILLARCGEGLPTPGRPFDHRPYDEEDLQVALELGRRAGMAMDNARLYQAARRALEARDEVLGIVSHDLGNPLQAIFIGLEALERSRSGRTEGRPGQEEYYLTAIRRSVEVMERLIQDLLEVRRMESGRLELDPRPRSLGPLVNEALQMLLPLARVKNIDVTNDVPADGLPEVWVDGDRIQQVLSNLVGNAVKHTPEDGSVRLTCEVTAEELVIHVTDTGSGIPAEDLERVFDRFWRAGKRRGRGIGLGLAIARGIVRGHGGRIWVRSAVGTGSTFSFSLPLERTPPPGPS